MHHLPSLFSLFSAVPNRFKYRQNAPVTALVFIISLQFQVVSNTVRMHHLPSLFSLFLCSSKSFKIPSECTIYRPCFHYFLHFQIVSNTARMHHVPSLFSFFSAVPTRFKYRQNACLRHIVLIMFLCIFKSFQILSECLLQRPCFKKNISLKLQNIISDSVRLQKCQFSTVSDRAGPVPHPHHNTTSQNRPCTRHVNY